MPRCRMPSLRIGGRNFGGLHAFDPLEGSLRGERIGQDPRHVRVAEQGGIRDVHARCNWLYHRDMEADAAYRQEISEDLYHCIEKRARGGGIEVAKGDDTEFTVKRLSTPVATCNVELLPGEPSFQVHFGFCSPSFTFSNVTFTVSDRDYDHLGIKTTRQFASVDEAADWLINSLSCNVAQPLRRTLGAEPGSWT